MQNFDRLFSVGVAFGNSAEFQAGWRHLCSFYGMPGEGACVRYGSTAPGWRSLSTVTEVGDIVVTQHAGDHMPYHVNV